MSIFFEACERQAGQSGHLETGADMVYILLNTEERVITVHDSSESLTPQKLEEGIKEALNAMYIHYDSLAAHENLDPDKESDPKKGVELPDTSKRLHVISNSRN